MGVVPSSEYGVEPFLGGLLKVLESKPDALEGVWVE